MKLKNLMTAFAMTTLIFSTACADTKKENEQKENKEVTTENVTKKEVAEQAPTIVGVAASNDDFSTLVAAVKAASLVETLNSEGPFTVFVPTNAAFDKLPAGTVDGLLKPESKDALTSILTYHVVSGKFMAADVVKAIGENDSKFSIATVQGGTLVASLNGDNVILTDENGNTSTIIMTDVAASNGVIHAIDSVVMPK